MSNFESTSFGCYTSPDWERKIYAERSNFDGDMRLYRHTINDKYYTYRRGATFLSKKIQQVLGETKFLESWRKEFAKTLEKGEDGVNEYVNATADFGTNLHILYNMYIKGGLDMAFIKDHIIELSNRYNLSPYASIIAEQTMIKGVLSLREFTIEKEVNVLSIEQMVTDTSINISTPIDIVCTFNFNRKKVIGLINIKSSENQQDHSWQCLIERFCFMNSFPEFADKDVFVGTLRPLKFKDKPTYELKNYTDFAKDQENIQTMLSVAKLINKSNPIPKTSLFSWNGVLSDSTIIESAPLFPLEIDRI